MHNYSNILVLTASFCLTFTLALAWCLAGVRSTEVMKKIFPSFQYLLKSHIDYLMMTGLLMVFFLLFSHFQTSPSLVVVISMCVGSVVNPAGFMMLAIKPNHAALWHRDVPPERPAIGGNGRTFLPLG